MSANWLFDSKKWMRLIFTAWVSITLSCSGNIYTENSNHDRDEALLEDAIKAINDGNYDLALEKLNRITTSFRSEKRVAKTIAAAYAGRCGINFGSLVDRIGQTSSDSPYMMMMKSFQSRSVHPEACYESQKAVEVTFGTNSAVRDSDINLFMAILGLAKIGTYLKTTADPNGNGTPDPGFDGCDPASISDDDTKQVGTGLGLVLDNLSALSAAISGGSALATLVALKNMCDVNNLDCTLTDPTDPVWDDPDVVKAFRSTIRSSVFGIGNCALNPFVLCCP